MSRPAAVLLYAVGILLAAIAGFAQFAESGEWISAGLYCVLVPAGAIYEWWRAFHRGAEAAEVAERMLAIVLLAMIGIGAAGS